MRTANDPAAYDQLLDIAWKLALVFGCAFGAEWLVFRADQAAGGAAGSAHSAGRTCAGAGAGDRRSAVLDGRCHRRAGELHRRHLSLARAWQSLVRLPFVLGRLLLELLPVVVFVGVATMLLGTEIGDLATTRLVILAVVNAYAMSRGLICVVRALVGTVRPVPGARRDRGLYRDLDAAHRRRRASPASPLPTSRCCSACIAAAMRRCCGW